MACASTSLQRLSLGQTTSWWSRPLLRRIVASCRDRNEAPHFTPDVLTCPFSRARASDACKNGHVAEETALPCPFLHTHGGGVCRNGQIKGKISTSVSVSAHTRRLRVQKRTNQRQGRRPRVRFRTRTMATCAETDTLGSEPAPSCPKKHTHCGGVCTNGHLAEESASILKRLFAVANQPSVPDGCQTAPQRRFFF